MAHASMQLAYTCWPACVAAGIAPARITRTIANRIKAAATRYVVNEPVSSSDCHRTMPRSREPCLCRHTPLVTRTGATSMPFFFRVLHTMFSHLRAHAFALSVTVARSSAVHASSSRRQERRCAIVCGSPQSQSTDWASSR